MLVMLANQAKNQFKISVVLTNLKVTLGGHASGVHNTLWDFATVELHDTQWSSALIY